MYYSRWCTLIRASEESLSSDMVERKYVLNNFSWLLALSVSQVATGNVHAIANSILMLGKAPSSQHSSAS